MNEIDKFLVMNDVSWYAFAVFVFYHITIYLRRFSKVYVIVFSIVASCMIGFAQDVNTYLSLSRIFTYYPIFLIGYCLDIDKVLEFSKKKIVTVISWVVMAVSGVVVYFKIDEIYWFLTILKGKNGYYRLEEYAEFGFVGRLLWYPLVLILIFAIIAIVPSVRCIFTQIGRRSMQIYALHYVPMLAFFKVVEGKNWADYIWPEHELILVLGIAFLTTCLLGIKPIEIVMNKIIYPKINSTDN